MNGVVVWLTGLPASGKTTLAGRIRAQLVVKGLPCAVLDGDEVRGALMPAPGYDESERASFYATLGNLAGLLARQGLIVLVAATAHRRAFRESARAVAPRFLEILVETPQAECARRDPKGLYRKAEHAVIAGLSDVGVAYEPPTSPDVAARGGLDEQACRRTIELIGTGAASAR